MSHEIKAYTVNEFCRVMSLSRTTVYELISNDEISAISIAGRRLIPATEVDKLLDIALSQPRKRLHRGGASRAA